MKSFFLSCALVLLVAACTTPRHASTAWQSRQTPGAWAASFDRFTGREQLRFRRQGQQMLYLSRQLASPAGELQVQVNGQLLSAAAGTVVHDKLPLRRGARVAVVGRQAQGSFKLRYPVYRQPQIQVSLSSNLELLNLCNLLLQYEDLAALPETQTVPFAGKQVKLKDLYALNLKLAAPFTKFAASPHLAIIKSYFDKSFYLHYANFALSLPDFPRASVPAGSAFSHQFASPADAQRFVDACNAFYQEIGFDAFLRQRRPYYAAMQAEVSRNLPSPAFLTEMEHFYGQPSATYRLYPSLTMLFSSGFAVGGDHTIGNVFGSFVPPANVADTAALRLGFADRQALRTVCVHEFGHSFVNPAIDQLSAASLAASAARFEPIREQMSAQGYNEWKICLYEHFTRAGEVLTARLVGDQAKAQELLADNVQQRHFRYLPQIVEQLQYWYDHEYLNKTYPQKVQEIVASLN
jgi:hypothetical protein